MSKLSAGQLVTSNLQLIRQLGAGGMGTVWVGHHLGLKTDVVVKFITGDLAQSVEARARFEREAAAASEVKSPHVVHMIDHGIAQNELPYIAMELLEGEDLAARIVRERLMPAGEVAALVAQVCRALARAQLDRREDTMRFEPTGRIHRLAFAHANRVALHRGLRAHNRPRDRDHRLSDRRRQSVLDLLARCLWRALGSDLWSGRRPEEPQLE